MQEKSRNTDTRAEDDFMDIANAILNDLSPVIREEIWKAYDNEHGDPDDDWNDCDEDTDCECVSDDIECCTRIDNGI